MAKILFVSHSSEWGGAEKCLYLLLAALPRDQFESIVLLPDGGALATAIEALGIETRRGPFLPWVRPWIDHWRGPGFEEGVAEISRLIKTEKVDVVFSNTSVVVGGALAARLCGVPHVWHVLEMLSSDPHLKPTVGFREFYSLMQILSDKVIAGSHSVKAEIEQFVKSPATEIIHTVVEDTNEQAIERRKEAVFGVPEETFVISFVGDMSARKGIEDLIRCAPTVLARNQNARFMIAGRDAERGAAVRRQISQNGLEDAIRLLGFRDDVKSIMAASDVFVLPTRSDPLPLVVQEAMSVGTPVIATLSGGCSDMVVDGETGLLVPIRDPDALAVAIIRLMESPAERNEMGELGRQRLSTVFSHKDYVEKMSSMLLQLVGREVPQTVTMANDNVTGLLFHCLDACGTQHGLTDRNQKLIASRDAIEQSRDAIEHAFSTRLGRTLTSPWRGIRNLLGK